MNFRFQKLILTVILLVTTNVDAANEIIADYQSNKTKHQIEADLRFGITTNAGKLDNPTSGNYLLFQPKVNLLYPISSAFTFNPTVTGNIRRFTEGSASDIGNSFTGQLNLTTYWAPTPNWKHGLTGSLSIDELREATSNGVAVSSRLQRFSESGVSLFSNWSPSPRWEVGMGFSLAARRYSTFTTEARIGNAEFQDHQNTIRARLRTKLKISKQISFELENSLSRKNYLNRGASFSNGAPQVAASPHPKEAILTHQHQITVRSSLGSAKIVSKASVSFDNDVVFSAQDGYRWKLEQQLKFPLQKKFTLSPYASISRKTFTTFTINPVSSPNIQETRYDWIGEISAIMLYKVSRQIQFNASYGYHWQRTNYAQDADFLEHLFESGFSFEL